MKLQTASETISFIKELETKSAKFYEDLAQKYSKNEDTLLSYAKESKKYSKQIQMAYQSVITDAIEGCYAFNLDSDEFTFDTELPEQATYSDILRCGSQAIYGSDGRCSKEFCNYRKEEKEAYTYAEVTQLKKPACSTLAAG